MYKVSKFKSISKKFAKKVNRNGPAWPGSPIFESRLGLVSATQYEDAPGDQVATAPAQVAVSSPGPAAARRTTPAIRLLRIPARVTFS